MSTPRMTIAVTEDLERVWDEFGSSTVTHGIDERFNVDWMVLPKTDLIGPAMIRDVDILALLKPRITAGTLGPHPRLSLIARWGVGLDNVDIDACTDRGVLISVAPDGVRRPMAMAALTMLLAVSTRLIQKHELVRSGVWDRTAYPGRAVTGRTLGIVGLGNIGQEFAGLIAPLGMRVLAYDPHLTALPPGIDAQLVPLRDLLVESDFVCVLCPLTDETRHLIDAHALSLIGPDGHLINVARGGIVDEAALIDALREGHIAGAGLDVFEEEPLASDSPLRVLPNVVMAPHSLGWTDELIAGNDAGVLDAIVRYLGRSTPRHLANRSALDHERQRAFLGQAGMSLESDSEKGS